MKDIAIKLNIEKSVDEEFFYHIFEMEKHWKESLPKFHDKELLGLFPGVRDIVCPKISELEEIIKEKETEISKELDRINRLNVDDFSKWFGREIVKTTIVSELREYDRELLNFKKYERLLNPSENYVSNFQEKIEVARNYPIYEIASQYIQLRPYGNKYVGLCPFHNEKSPSFYIYIESNTYHCFGCGAHGDVISLTMELHGVDFKNAVEILQK